VAILTKVVEERTDLSRADTDLLSQVVLDWMLLADLALSDLVMWVPTWNEAGLMAVAHVRPTTAPTSVPDDVPGTFSPRGRNPHLDQAAAFGRAIVFRDAQRPSVPLNVEAYPIRHGDRVIGVVARHASVAPRVAGQLEEIYLTTADDLFAMLVDGRYPVPDIHTDALGSPRVGDGVIRLSADGRVDYASPNSVSALRRLGLATDVVGSPFVELAARLSHRPGPVDEALSAVASGRVAGSSDIENGSAIVLLRSIPLARRGQHVGAIVFLQDVTDVRRRERALISKDATIREIHHRVKNNLQTVAAMLRLQARRASTPEAREALAEAELRVSAIAVVHESLTADVGEQVDFDAIVDRIIGLVRDLAPAYAGGAEPPSIAREGTLGQLSADQATPLAMVVSELLHNAVEHASAAAITVGLQRRTAYGHDLVDLTVLDDGCGLPDGFDATETGLGLSIVQALVSGDLRGTCEFAGNAEGTTVSVAFPVSRAR
jgi:two-component sensor histidine kinase